MNVTKTNEISVYNLTSGKSLPDWLDERKRRTLLKKDEYLRNRRIELIQDFDMPAVSDTIATSPDGNYVIVTGTYKPRVKCYDVSQLALKFERCFDSEVVKVRLLEDDYSKMMFLHCDRYVELHSQSGRYYRLRIPKYGRDLEYNRSNCDAYFVGDGSDIVRLNLEQGRFLSPFVTDSREGSIGFNVIRLNPEHQLLTVGSIDGRVEAWDPRVRNRVGILDIGGSVSSLGSNSLPSITSLSFRDGLNMAVGTMTGHVLLYDIRSPTPLLTKDHMYGMPIKALTFHSTLDQVLSLDCKALKIWDRKTGKPYAAIEGPRNHDIKLNDFSIYPGSGLLFMTNEQPKIQVHYIPSLGPAPKWCGFLDNITEELEEDEISAVYDDYKFVTKDEVVDLGMEHLIGTSLMRAHMHGFFMDVRLYRKAQSLAKPYTLDKFMKDKIKSKVEEQREQRVQMKSKLPRVNKDLYLKLKDLQENPKAKKRNQGSLLEDTRFSSIFNDPRFQVDTSDEAYRLLNPVVSKLDDSKKRKLERQFEQVREDDVDDFESGKSEDSDLNDDDDEESSSDDDDQKWTETVKAEHRKLKTEKAEAKRIEKEEKLMAKLAKMKKPKFYELKDGEEFGKMNKKDRKNKTVSLEDRIKDEPNDVVRHGDGHQMSFEIKKSFKQLKKEKEMKEHREERKALRRSASHLKKKKIAPKFWMGKRVV